MSQQISLAQQIDYIIDGGYDDIDAAPEFLLREAAACYMRELKGPMAKQWRAEFLTTDEAIDKAVDILAVALETGTQEAKDDCMEVILAGAGNYARELIRDQFNDRVAERKRDAAEEAKNRSRHPDYD